MYKELATYQPESSSVVVYHSDDDAVQLEVQLSEETIWLTQKQMSWLFDTTSQNITIHIRAEIVARPEDYLYSSALNYAGEKGLLNVELIS